MPHRNSFFLIFFTCSFTILNGCASIHIQDEQLTSKIKSAKKIETVWNPFWTGPDGRVIIPFIPQPIEHLLEQSLIYEDITIWSKRWANGYRGYGSPMTFHISPDYNKIFVSEWGTDNKPPPFILHYNPIKQITIQLPVEFDKSYYRYPLEFLSWEAESNSIIMKAIAGTHNYNGIESDLKGVTWRADVKSGEVSHLHGKPIPVEKIEYCK